MSYECLNGVLLRNLLINGLLNLKLHEQEINKMNVFPVPDGDTGTNMRLTLENGIKNTIETPSLGAFTKSLSKGALFGARGNSGVILSQFIKGLSLSVASLDVAYGIDLVDACIKGYETVYSAVIHPAEGTMLTVLREGIENIKDKITKATSIDQFIDLYLIELKKSLLDTPNKLEILKKAHVLDSGGQGIVTIVEGAQKYLHHENLDSSSLTMDIFKGNQEEKSFNADSVLTYGYCNEFVLQLQKSKIDIATFSLNDFIDQLNELGDSLVACMDDDIVKVHIHSFFPAPIIHLAQKYGEFISYKMENMSLQHNEIIIKENMEMPHKEIGYISVAQGDGIIDQLKKFGCDIVINGGQTMNSSIDEFLDAFKKINADHIFVFPNDKNLLLSALQAKNLIKNKNIIVVETTSIQECYFALSMLDLEETNINKQIENINNGISKVISLKTTKAIRNYVSDQINCLQGDYITMMNNKMISASSNIVESIIVALKNINLEDNEICMIIKGQQVNDEVIEELQEQIYNIADHLEIGIVDGKQDVYDILIGLS